MFTVPEPHTPVSTTAQHLWETAVCLATARARQALPDSNGRIDRAMQLVLDGAVELLDDHSAKVTSQRDGATVYYVVNGTCQCRDFPNPPQLMCKHRIARGIAVRAVQVAKELGDTHATTASPQPAIPAEFIVQIQGKPFITVQGLLHLAHQQGLLSLTEEVTHVTDSYVLATARAEMSDGWVFRGVGDSTPDNVGAKVKPHWHRMAGTRAKARALRDALNLGGLVAVEELD
jgi:hypothetical protein